MPGEQGGVNGALCHDNEGVGDGNEGIGHSNKGVGLPRDLLPEGRGGPENNAALRGGWGAHAEGDGRDTAWPSVREEHGGAWSSMGGGIGGAPRGHGGQPCSHQSPAHQHIDTRVA